MHICAICGSSTDYSPLLHCTKCNNYSICLSCAATTTHSKEHTFVILPQEKNPHMSSTSSDSNHSRDINLEYLPLLSYPVYPYSETSTVEEKSLPPSIDISVEYL